MTDAIVVGAGPNGLAAAVTLAQHGLRVTVLEAGDEIGGGTRTSELTLPGLLHDHCSAVHPMGVASPFLRNLDLQRHGLVWRWPEVDLAHPLDTGTAGVMLHSLAETCSGLGPDGPAWQRFFGPLTEVFDELCEDLMRPVTHLPRHPAVLLRFGIGALRPASAVARRWCTDEGRALFAGVAAHGLQSLTRPATAAIGIVLATAGHRFGWPVAEGGSRAITSALAARLHELGGKIETGVRVRSLDELPSTRTVMLDLAPRAAADVCGDRLPALVRRAYHRWRHGPAAFKVDLAVEGGIPWTAEACRRAGTVHLGGTLAEIESAEQQIQRGKMPERPFVLIGQQYLADPTRSHHDLHPLWAYAHVPHGYDGDATEAVLRQIERFAPGFRDRIAATATRSPAQFAAYNANYVGGDISTGANTLRQIALRPRMLTLDPYRTGIPGVYLCSAATPPGAGVHGMCGYNAARSALRQLYRG